MAQMKNGKRLYLFEIFFVILIIIVFLMLFNKYYYHELNKKVLYVSPNFNKLEKEASQINSSYGLTNKTANDILVFTYHSITKEDPNSEFRISYDQFKEMMFALKREGYNTITLKDFNEFMRGEKELPEKSFLLTFDDGSRQTFYNGDPILKVLNYTAVFFIITVHPENLSGNSYYMTADELKTAFSTGRWELGSHTDEGHYRLQVDEQGTLGPALTNKLWLQDKNRLETDEEYYNRVSRDLVTSKQKLENLTNGSIIGFALPYGHFADRSTNYPEANKILANLTTSIYDLVFYEFPYRYSLYRSNYNDDPTKQGYLISRISADNPSKDPLRFLQLINSSRAINLPYVEDFVNQDRWVRVGGEASFNNDSIELFIREENSIVSYIDGSYFWDDYSYSLQLNNLEVSRVSLISRFKDPQNYVACLYEGNEVSIVRALENFPTNKVAKAAISSPLSAGARLGMSVNGPFVECNYNGNLIVAAEITDMPKYGGVGIKGENAIVDDATLVFSNITVNSLD